MTNKIKTLDNEISWGYKITNKKLNEIINILNEHIDKIDKLVTLLDKKTKYYTKIKK